MLPGAMEIERAGLECWPSVEIGWDGSWARRAARGYTKRANSTQCFDPADDRDIAARVADARAWHEARNLTPIFRINELAPLALVEHLDAAGWVTLEHSRVMGMMLDEGDPDPRFAVLAVDDPDFLDAQARLKQLSPEETKQLRAVLRIIMTPACGLVLRDADGQPVASALLAVSEGIAITGNVITAPAARRQGIAARLMRTAHAWAGLHGATVAALNVVADNEAALALYSSLGYRPLYDYVYRLPGVAA